MRADNSGHIIAAARRRSDDARRKATAALRRMDASGQPLTFSTIAAAAAGVSRSWLYAQDDLRGQIERLRTRQQQAPAAPQIPDRQRATPASLLRRLEAATTRIRARKQTPASCATPSSTPSATGARRGDPHASRDTPGKHAIEKTPRRCSRCGRKPVNNTVHDANQQVRKVSNRRAKDNERQVAQPGVLGAADPVLAAGPAPVQQLQVRELALLRVGGEGGEPVPVDVGEPQWRPRARAFLTDYDPHPGRPGGKIEHPGDVGDPRPVPDLPAAVESWRPGILPGP